MNETLMKALESLDSSNDNHWTTEGLPKLEALRFAYGSAVTRDEVEATAPGYTRENRVFATAEVSLQTGSEDGVVFEPGHVTIDEPAAPASTALSVKFDVDNLVHAMLAPLELTPVEELSNEQLQELADNHSAFVSADRQLIDQLTDRAQQRARYLSTVSTEMEKRNPAPSTADAMAAFRARVASSDLSKLAANKPRVMQRTVTPLLKG